LQEVIQPYPAAATAVHKREVSTCVTLSLKQVLKLIEEGKFYKSTTWEKKRLKILERDNYECQVCKEEGGFAPATTVHHIIHLKDRPDLALDDDNLLSVCAACHNREHPERFIHRIMEPKRNKLAERFPERW
jgi:5-methylcytosine-specific restriction endonuclease McrA